MGDARILRPFQKCCTKYPTLLLSFQSVGLGLIFKVWGCGEQEVGGGRSELVESQALDL